MTSRVDAATSWRVVCPNFEQDGHYTHGVRPMATLEEAKAKAGMNDRLYERLAEHDDGTGLVSYYRSEIGWRVQKQTVTEWNDV